MVRCAGCLLLLVDLTLVALTIAFPVMKFATKTDPYTDWTDVQVFSPLIAIAVVNVVLVVSMCCCMSVIAVWPPGD